MFIRGVFHIPKLILLLLIGCICPTYAQISPGELVKVHAHLEGMSNCTQCHTLGAKVSNSKCLACHTEIKKRIDQKKGYHASIAVKGKECASCHNDHHGRNFQITRFDPSKFQHDLTGYKLEGGHSKQICNACHTSKNISDPKLKGKANTYLGLDTKCLSCHTDYHRNTLSENCTNCHNQESFKPAIKFNHANTKYPLVGKHQSVDCAKCHKIETRDGKKFQNFAGIQFNHCTNCHTDVHQNKFGQNCTQCHSELSFHTIKRTLKFDHSKTGFVLEGKHMQASCTSCHKTNFTDPLKHNNCFDCHTDYHNGQFATSGKSPDCNKCHSVKGFTPSNYTLEQHKQTVFALKGAHEAVACFECHKKQEKWSFRNIGNRCVDCHKDEHQATISAKYYPEKNCRICHVENTWSQINFDHSKTDFQLTGVHFNTNCRACHYKKEKSGHYQQMFAGLPKSCTNCHADNHNRQFEKNGITECSECHTTENWKASKFDHNHTAFKLDGKHKNVACAKCHKPIAGEKYIQYKIKNFRCETCH
jgi:hypothetical protein